MSGSDISLLEWQTSLSLVPYPQALADMEQRASDIADGSKRERIWLLEHPPLYTTGTSAKLSDLIQPDRFPTYAAGRGGEYTYHGPGQRIAYVQLNLANRGRDVRCFVSNLESWIIAMLADFGLTGHRRIGRVGVWIEDELGQDFKIASIGVRVRRWITLHGISINVSPDLEHFAGIVPCGISQYGITSFKKLGLGVSMQEIDAALIKNFPYIFETIRPTTCYAR
jgi:lipoyl(octanoyl) transferase